MYKRRMRNKDGSYTKWEEKGLEASKEVISLLRIVETVTLTTYGGKQVQWARSDNTKDIVSIKEAKDSGFRITKLRHVGKYRPTYDQSLDQRKFVYHYVIEDEI